MDKSKENKTLEEWKWQNRIFGIMCTATLTVLPLDMITASYVYGVVTISEKFVTS